jgi:hypothetical protein
MDRDVSFHLIFRQRRNRLYGLSVRLTERAPVLAPGEVAVLTRVRLPEALFQRPRLTATIAIPAAEMPARAIPAAVQENIAAEIQKLLGVGVTIKVEPAR